MQQTCGPHRITFEVLFPRSPAHGNTCLGTLRQTIRMCSRQTETPTILMQSWCRVFGHRFRRIVMFNEMLHICAFWWRHCLRNVAEPPSKHNSNSLNGTCDTHFVTRHTEKRKTYQETVTSRHDAEHAVISNATQQ